MDRSIFFAEIKASLFKGRFTPGQVQGIDAVLDEAERRKTPLKWLAYMFATDFHETARTMQPIAEYGRGRGKKYGKPMKYKQAPYGRGLVQLTWDFNYETADKELGLGGAMLANFDLAMKMEYAVKIMFSGMEQGWFTKKKLADFTSYVPMRRIINGTDKAAAIAGYANMFENALLHAGYGKAAPVIPHETVQGETIKPEAAIPVSPAKPDVHGLAALIGEIFKAIAAMFRRKS